MFRASVESVPQLEEWFPVGVPQLEIVFYLAA
jgi:hypothetical protein